ncbi:pre-mRNA-splicing factor SLU7-like [Mya arenaria]|uniref:pre-mRNA-splicing factor SLU7-like n=1 Tax=Mya arenaria TaxID=6604 RepID=UPI0022DF6DCB|nr:pre-mRNA-splicing factor SLU7-like [Mya arenaria]XP_052773364.1 pre-mRNA-splicing factor SLU7-like [Mya arenaria]XP_052773394.1 pre-mRNA-splicing factor SLU7-like [Mya arenaria]XP_052773395.1 pre-mRNA-splicing factor SLU7-like [Mya arenaria]
MSFISNLPPSVVAKQGRTEGESDEPQKKSREDYKKMKELEEARKAGTVPAMQDEDGNDINPHIPQYIMQVPWFFGEQRPTLKHQRPQPEKQKRFSDLQEWFKKGVKEGPVSTKFRKGACENCGAMTHKKKDCLERPRKIGAKFTGDNFAPDEHLQSDLAFDYEGKRDRWNGYNPDEHQKIYEDFEKIEEAKRLLKEKKIEENFLDGSEKQVIEEEKVAGDSDDEDKYADDVDMPGQKFETKQRITVRNLRIREDTAKYLFNLDTSSAHYDPKTRSMREDPFKNTSKEKEAEFHGDNFVRYSGDAKQFAKNQMFAWDAYEHGADVHLQADPTKLALLSREVKKRKEDTKTDAKQSILDRYGGEEHLEAPPKQLLLAQTEDYTEYSRHGTVIKGTEKPVVRSKYQEDVLINNHTSVWGSYWSAGHWGFKCCCSFIKESYCTGLAGIEAAQKQSLIPIEAVHSEGEEEEESQQKSLEEEHQERLKEKKKKKKQKKKNRKRKKKRRASSSESSSSSEESDADSEEEERRKQKKLAKALKKEAESQRRAEQLLAIDERKRPYNSMFEAKAPTEEEMEAWRMKRPRMEDPMTHFT